jgi:hypothetical protein
MNLFFIWRLDLMVLMWADPLLRPFEGVDPEISTFWDQMALASYIAISWPKKVSIFRANTFQKALVLDVARIKIIMARAI